MKYEYYAAVYTADDLSIFDFVSTGKNGSIRKRIIFAKMEEKGIYNLAFGKVRPDERIDDDSITDNGDGNKILATIATVVDKYTQRYPRRWIFFKGNTPAKMRLYRMVIGTHLLELSEKFEIYAELEGMEKYVLFQRDMAAIAFFIRRRIVFSSLLPEIL